jgi:ribonuclease J
VTDKLRIIPLGGLGEIGKNMMAVEYGEAILVIDAGMMFPEHDMLGVDVVIPNIEYLVANRERIRALVITHGHEDHIGALPYVLPLLGNLPIYATKLTAGLIQVKLKLNRIRDADIRIVGQHDTLKLDPFTVEFYHVSHSIPDCVGLAVTTSAGIIVHSGDFKFDPSPVDGELTDFAKLAEFGGRGVLALMSDSTNSDSPGHTPSEGIISDTFARVMALADGRVIIASFASNISRIQQAINASLRFNRMVCIVGRSMQDNVKMALEYGYLSAPEDIFIAPHELGRYPPNAICIVCTGGQGEPTSALARMANRDHRQVTLLRGDTVILSSVAIPGNEELVNRTLNNLFREGAIVYYDRLMDVHVSGHASREEQKLMLNLVRPKYFIPIHGEYRHLALHGHLAESVGMASENVFVVENGAIIEFENGSGRVLVERTNADDVMVDGLGVGDVGNVVLRDRHHLSQDGFLIVMVGLDRHTGDIVFGPEIETRGFVYNPQAEDILDGAKEQVLNAIRESAHDTDMSTKLKEVLSLYLYSHTKRRPMVIPVVIEM